MERKPQLSDKHIVKVVRYYEYEVPIDSSEAEDIYDAIELVRDFEIEDLEPYEVQAYFEFEEA
jgi:hypothetical protein